MSGEPQVVEIRSSVTRREAIHDDNDDDDMSMYVSMPESDAREYAKRGACANGLRRSPAVYLTFLIELLPAFVIVNDLDDLEERLGEEKAHVLVGFMAVISAISGNIGLQASTAITRALGIFRDASRSFGLLWGKEVRTGLLMAILIASTTGLVAGGWAQSVRVGLCCGLAQLLASTMAGITGSAAPFVFKRLFGKCRLGDPALWAGPLETGIQDIIGSLALFKLSKLLVFQILPDWLS